MMGIYAIQNKNNKKMYVGSSIDVDHRIYEHRLKLNKNEHDNPYLQNAWNKYGNDCFNFIILNEITDIKCLLDQEQQYIDNIGVDNLYNINPIAQKPPLKSWFFNPDGTKTSLYPQKGDNVRDFQILSEFIKVNGVNFIKCKCKCGNVKKYNVYNLIIKKYPKNCGCDKSHMKSYKHGATIRGVETSEFKTWKRMIELCYSPNNKSYHRYGGKGIIVCDEWKNDFSKFLDDMGEKPSIKHILGRKDTSENYSKNNCFWTTIKEQNNNRKDTIYLEYKGIKKPLRKWAEEIGIKPKTLWERIKKGWSTERALTECVYIGKNQYN